MSEGNKDCVETLLANFANVDMQNYFGETALFLAAARGFDDICYMLLEHGADPNISNGEGTTPAHIASAKGNLGALVILISLGAFVNAQDEDGDTVIHYAIREGQKEIVEFLVTCCDVGCENNDKETPLELASCLNETDLVKMLLACAKYQEVSRL